MSGVAAISHLEIEAWARLYGVVPSPAEVAVIGDLDQAFLAMCRGGGEAVSAAEPERSSIPLTAELFDALWK